LTCGAVVPEGRKFHRFARIKLRDISAFDLIEETAALAHYVEALSEAISALGEETLERPTLTTLFELLWSLTEETDRRGELAHHLWFDTEVDESDKPASDTETDAEKER